jgi:multidrug efflux pump subunit AcrA (membrane-fusion protein)
MGGRIEQGETERRMKKGKAIKGLMILAGIGVLIAAGWSFMSGGSAEVGQVPTFVVQRGPLEINVLQGGEIRALQNTEVKSEIEIPTKILSLIPEGYLITEDDVKDGKVLIELDNTDLKTKIQTHEIEFQTTVSNYIDADENREIQKSENQSLVRDTKQVAIFALMDFEKYLGREVTAAILTAAKLPKDVDAFEVAQWTGEKLLNFAKVSAYALGVYKDAGSGHNVLHESACPRARQGEVKLDESVL